MYEHHPCWLFRITSEMISLKQTLIHADKLSSPYSSTHIACWTILLLRAVLSLMNIIIFMMVFLSTECPRISAMSWICGIENQLYVLGSSWKCSWQVLLILQAAIWNRWRVSGFCLSRDACLTRVDDTFIILLLQFLTHWCSLAL